MAALLEAQNQALEGYGKRIDELGEGVEDVKGLKGGILGRGVSSPQSAGSSWRISRAGLWAWTAEQGGGAAAGGSGGARRGAGARGPGAADRAALAGLP